MARGWSTAVLRMAPGPVDNAQVAVLDLKTGQARTLIRGASQAAYVETGHLIYAAAGSLRAVRFDLGRMETRGESMLIVEHVMVKQGGAANYAVSRPGTLVYVPGAVGIVAPPRTLVWVDRQGHETTINAPPRAYAIARLSPDPCQARRECR